VSQTLNHAIGNAHGSAIFGTSRQAGELPLTGAATFIAAFVHAAARQFRCIDGEHLHVPWRPAAAHLLRDVTVHLISGESQMIVALRA
jgi:hypothetical protein